MINDLNVGGRSPINLEQWPSILPEFLGSFIRAVVINVSSSYFSISCINFILITRLKLNN
jgi:hypothetical protein